MNDKTTTLLSGWDIASLDFDMEDGVLAWLKKQPVGRRPLFKTEDEIDWETTVPALVEDLIPAVGVAILYSAPEAGKTPIAWDLACAVAEGKNWIDKPVNYPGDVVYIPMEGIEALGRYRTGYRRLHGPRWSGAPGHVYVHVYNDPDLDALGPLVEQHETESGRTRLWLETGATRIRDGLRDQDIDPRLIVLDTQIDFMSADMDENNSNDIKRLYEAAAKIAEEFRCVVLFVHHATKSSEEGWPEYRGSGGMGGKVVCKMALKVNKKTRGAGHIKFTKRKGLPGAGEPTYPYYPSEGATPEEGFCIAWSPQGEPLTVDQAAAAYLADNPDVVTTANTREAVLEILAGWSKSMQRANNPTSGWSRNELRNELKYRSDAGQDVWSSNAAIDRLLAEMTQEGLIRDGKPDDGSASEWQLV